MKEKLGFIFLSFLVVFAGGCRVLQDKFSRTREEKEAPVYVAFKDYPEKPTRQVYNDYYLYTRGWLDELVKALDKGISYKRQSYAVSEALLNLEQIVSFFNPAGKQAIASLHQELKEIKAEIERNPNLSQFRRNYLLRRAQRIKRDLGSYTYSNVEEWLN